MENLDQIIKGWPKSETQPLFLWDDDLVRRNAHA